MEVWAEICGCEEGLALHVKDITSVGDVGKVPVAGGRVARASVQSLQGIVFTALMASNSVYWNSDESQI